MAHVARLGSQLASDLAALALMPDDSPTRLKGQPGMSTSGGLVRADTAGPSQGHRQGAQLLGQRRAAELRGRRHRRLPARAGRRHRGQEIRAMVPINLRPMSEAWKLGNRFGLVPLVLPIGVDNPIERVFAVRARMNASRAACSRC
jgi:diacylglycerol O-acyltransferase / wax synthase